jgi:GH35 family endo-1,4-beta-xylanase
MNRRDFIRNVGLGSAALAMPCDLLRSAEPTREDRKKVEEILGDLDSRIEKHRKGTATLEFTGPDGRPLKAGMKVRIHQTRHKFFFGCNLFKLNRCRTPQDNEAYVRRFGELLNFATLPFYWWSYTRRRGEPDDERTEQAVRWCLANNVTTKGHPLAWNYADPRWLPDDPKAVMKEQLARIERCVDKFRGEVDIWDVVNEATAYDRQHCKTYAPKLTKAIEQMGVGKYVREAFKAARGANPDAWLIINDYRTDPAFANKVINELADAEGRAIYDVVGIQSHMHGGYWGPRKAWDVCEYFAKFGKPLHFTETTLVSGAQGWELQKKRREQGFKWVTSAEGEERQARQVVEFYRVLFSHPGVEAITWWDFTDQNAWQGAPAGLVRADMSPKPAYEELIKLVKGQWWTKTEATVNGAGQVRLHGFYGDYDVQAEVNGRKLHSQVKLEKAAARIDARLS